jgi:glucose dehydrogenase
VLALDPDTGKEIWRFDPQIKSPVGFKGFAHMTCRGVSYYDEAATPVVTAAPRRKSPTPAKPLPRPARVACTCRPPMPA